MQINNYNIIDAIRKMSKSYFFLDGEGRNSSALVLTIQILRFIIEPKLLEIIWHWRNLQVHIRLKRQKF